jgi:hypothetical protein
LGWKAERKERVLATGSVLGGASPALFPMVAVLWTEVELGPFDIARGKKNPSLLTKINEPDDLFKISND